MRLADYLPLYSQFTQTFVVTFNFLSATFYRHDKKICFFENCITNVSFGTFNSKTCGFQGHNQ